MTELYEVSVMKVLVAHEWYHCYYFFKKGKTIHLIKVHEGRLPYDGDIVTTHAANHRFHSIEAIARYYQKRGIKSDLYTHRKDIPPEFWELLLRVKIGQ